jgi:phage gp36-like protein
MADYLTIADFAAWPGARHIAEACTPKDQPLVKSALMDALLRGLPTTGWTAPEVAIGNVALANLLTAGDEAEAEVNASIMVAGYTAPLLPAPPLLKQISKAITMFLIHSDLRINTANSNDGQHPIHARYEEARKQLSDIRNRKLSLGVGDPTPPSAGGGPAFFGGETRYFKRRSAGFQHD